jgi:hypothetical protein
MNLSHLSSSMVVEDCKMIDPYIIEHNIMTDDQCFSCQRPVSYAFTNLSGIKRWYCGYCAVSIAKVDSIQSLNTQLQSMKL